MKYQVEVRNRATKEVTNTVIESDYRDGAMIATYKRFPESAYVIVGARKISEKKAAEFIAAGALDQDAPVAVEATAGVTLVADVVEVEGKVEVLEAVETIDVLTKAGIKHEVVATYDHAFHSSTAKLVKVHEEQECWLAVFFWHGEYKGFTTWGDRERAMESIRRSVGTGLEEVQRQVTK